MNFYYKRQLNICIYFKYSDFINNVRVFVFYYFISSFSCRVTPNLYHKMPKVTRNNNNNESSRKRKALTAAQKKEICLKKMSNPLLKQKELAYEYEVSEGMISDTIKAKDRWLSVDLNSHQAGLKRERKLPFITIEETLALWVE